MDTALKSPSTNKTQSQQCLIDKKNTLLKLGQINFINCLPLNYALARNQHELATNFEICDAVPAELNAKLYQRELDIAPISCFEYLLHKDNYKLFAGLCVSSKVEADSVLFFANEPIETLTQINLTNKSATAVHLLKVLLVKKYKLDLANLNFEVFSLNQDYPNKLLIGDEALLEDQSKYKYVYDLGREWYELTALPMVFGLWAAQKNLELSDELLEFFAKVKRDAFDSYLPDAIVESYLKTGIAKSKLKDYFNHLSYDLNEAEHRSIDLFEKYLLELALIN